MGEEIFRHTDTDGDSLEVYPGETRSTYKTGLIFRATTEELGEENFVSAGLPRDAVLSLIQVLTEWAYPAHTPEGPNRSLIEELIVKAVKDQVSAVLPLHLSPVGVPRPHGPAVFACTCHDSEGNSVLPDPEPGDVGHPRPPAAGGDICANPACGHRRDRHRSVCAKFTPGRGVCRCDVFQELEPLPVRPVPEAVEVHRIECGLCKQPWSDGHGQPGDVCAGVEAARQHPGDWTDALWRVQPSAPASESRYCDECGHSWEVHQGCITPPSEYGCISQQGKSICGCTRKIPS